MTSSHLVLASSSPRRQALLSAAGVTFAVVASGADETRLEHEDAAAYAERVAQAKAREVSSRIPEALVLGADTVVEIDGTILLKPVNTDDARRMLRILSGATHTVITAFAVARGGRLIESTPISARVTFRELNESEVEAYLATGEPFDKAGSYGIQDAGGGFIIAVEGGRDTVMGLPVAAVLDALHRQGFDAA